jgi:hypothetical protein
VHFALTYKTRVPALVIANPRIWGAPIPEDSFFHGKKYPIAEPGARDDPRLCKESLRRFLDGDLFATTRKNERAFRMLESVVLHHSCAPFQEERTSKVPDDFARLEEIRAPTLILSGELDDPFFRQCAEAAAARIPGARLDVLPGVGHVSNLEAAPEFNRKVLDFLASHGLMEAAPPGAEQPPKQRPKRKSRERRPGEEVQRVREREERDVRRAEPRREEARPRGRDERGRGERRREEARARGRHERSRGERGPGERSDPGKGRERPRDGEERERGGRGRRRRRPQRSERSDRQEREDRPARQGSGGSEGGRGRSRSREDQRSRGDQRGRDRSSRGRGRQRRDREAPTGGPEPRKRPADSEPKPRSDGALGKIRRFFFGKKKQKDD